MPEAPWLVLQAHLSLTRLLVRMNGRFAGETNAETWTKFTRRLEANFAQLFRLLLYLYGQHYDFFYHLENILAAAAAKVRGIAQRGGTDDEAISGWHA